MFPSKFCLVTVSLLPRPLGNLQVKRVMSCGSWGLVLFILAGTTYAAEYGEPCSKATDCTDPWAPFCHVFFRDDSYLANSM